MLFTSRQYLRIAIFNLDNHRKGRKIVFFVAAIYRTGQVVVGYQGKYQNTPLAQPSAALIAQWPPTLNSDGLNSQTTAPRLVNVETTVQESTRYVPESLRQKICHLVSRKSPILACSAKTKFMLDNWNDMLFASWTSKTNTKPTVRFRMYFQQTFQNNNWLNFW